MMIHFIVNRKSLRGKQKKLTDEISKILREEDREFAFYYPNCKEDCVAFAKSISESGEREIVVVGGDGTLNDVVCGLKYPSKVNLGLIPAGTGNDFAAAAGIPLGINALKLILNGRTKPTDYIDCGQYRSINIAGLGIDVDILERCERKKHGGKKSKYFFSLLSSLMHFKGLGLDVVVNGETTHYNALLAVVCNGSQFGGGIPICPCAEIGDGNLDLLIVECPKRGRIPFELIQLMKGKIVGRKISHHVLCDEAVIRPEKPRVVQFDGELYEQTELRAKLVKGGINLYR